MCPCAGRCAVLAWLAFGVASYLAWHAVIESSVAGCGMGSDNGCDVVLTSSWSKWLGIPVAVLGLGCYAALASLSILLWLRSEPASRWIATAFVMLSIIAAGASLWFIGVQVFAIHDYCKFCLVTDACGIAIGSIATFVAVRSWLADRGTAATAVQPGMMALRTALPAGTRPAPTTTTNNARHAPRHLRWATPWAARAALGPANRRPVSVCQQDIRCAKGRPRRFDQHDGLRSNRAD